MHAANDGDFCDELAIEKSRRHITSAVCGSFENLGFLILSGSFNPIHTQHVRALEAARRYLESVGWCVVGGFLAPSSDEYVKAKLRANALTIGQRIKLCKLAVEGSDWINVCSKGELSSNWVRRGVQSELERHCRDALKGRRLMGFEVMGSDAARRIFENILVRQKYGATGSTQSGRKICCFFRPGSENALERTGTEMFLESAAARLGIELILLDPASSDPVLEPVSSTAILELVKNNDWDALRSNRWLHPAVLKFLQRIGISGVLS